MSDLEDQQRPRKKRRTEPRPALYKAEVTILAQTGPPEQDPKSSGVDQKDLERIKKCLDRANHPNTPEAEAKAAFHVASLLMRRHNVTQAEVLCHTTPEEQTKYAGQSEVTIKRADGSDEPVNHQYWVNPLANAMRDFFDCKTYSTGCWNSIEWTFYGISDNTIAAAMAFEMAYNLIMEWARSRKGVATKNSYCIGVAEELSEMAQKDKKDEERKALEAERKTTASKVKEEEAQREAELRRLDPVGYDSTVASPGAINSDTQLGEDATFDNAGISEDEDEDEQFNTGAPDFKVEANDDSIDPFGDIEEEIMKRVKAEPASPKHDFNDVQQAEGDEIKSIWASSTQLTTFRATASRIADDYLKEQGIKLSKGSSRTSSVRDWDAYLEGRKDGKKIDVRQKRIEE